MNTFIGDLLEEARSLQLNPEIGFVDTRACVARACENLRMQIEQTAAVITVDDLLPVNASDVQLTRIFQNLIDNAIKYRAPDRRPEIAITSAASGNKVRIAVSDNGISIPAAEQDSVLRYFGRSSE
ncbi:MAG: ATP-binding protein, partial [Rhodospirillaceae bacterium]